MEKLSKKELKEQYKNRKVVGGIYCIKCNGNNRTWTKSTKDIKGQKNRFVFSVSIDSCIEADLFKEWKEYGAKSFSFTVLEEITKGEEQTDLEFQNDLDLLLEIWLEKPQGI